MKMKKFVFYIPAIIFIVLYGLLAIANIGAVSPVVIVWLVLFLMGGILLSKDNFWGSLLGMLPAIHLIYMGTQETRQIINEIPIGIVILIFYIICGYFIHRNNKKSKE
jgi:hypothetical protein